MCNVKSLAQRLIEQSSQLFSHYFFEAERHSGKPPTAIRGDIGRWSAANAMVIASNIKRKRSLMLFENQNEQISRFEKVNQKRKAFPICLDIKLDKRTLFQKRDL